MIIVWARDTVPFFVIGRQTVTEVLASYKYRPSAGDIFGMSPYRRRPRKLPELLVVPVAFRFQPLKNLQEAYQSRNWPIMCSYSARRKSSI